MGMQHLEPADREAIAQLRAVLRGERELSVAEEERLIAAFLQGRGNAVQGMPAAPDGGQGAEHSLDVLRLLPGVVPSVVVCLNFLIVILYGTAMGSLGATAAFLLSLFDGALFLGLFAGLLLALAQPLRRFTPAIVSALITVAVVAPIFVLGVVLDSPIGPLATLVPAVLVLIWSALRAFHQSARGANAWLGPYQAAAAPYREIPAPPR